MEFELIRIAITIFGCGIASYFDCFNNRNIPNSVTYGLILIGVILNLASFNLQLLISVFIISLLIIIIGYPLYIRGMIGGADILIFVAIALLIPYPLTPIFSPSQYISQYAIFNTFPFVFWVFFVSSLLFTICMFGYFSLKIFEDWVKKEKITFKKTNLLLAVFMIGIYSILLLYMNSLFPLKLVFVFLFYFILLATGFFLVFKDYIIDRYVIRVVGVEEIEEEDVLAIERMDKEIVKKYGLRKLLTKSEIERLRKIPELKKYPIYKNLPTFIPYIFFGVLFILLFGNPFHYLAT